MTHNLYAETTKIVYYSSQAELAAVAVEIAASSPSVFLRACKKAQKQQEIQSLDEALIALIKNGEYVRAIKHHRQVTGSTLIAAKQAIDVLKEQVCSSPGHG